MSFPRYPKYKDSGVEWLGKVPAHWEVCALNYRYEVALGKMLDEKRITGAHLAPYLRNTDVQWGRINVDDLPQMDFAGDDLVRYALKQGDLLVCEGGEVGRAAIWDARVAECYYQKALHRIRARAVGLDSAKFLYYFFFAAAATGVFANSGGKSTIAHLPAEALRRYRFTFPSLTEQTRIAEFLDRETAKIDALVAEQRRLMELLKEKRQAVISHAVTKGLDPSVKLKPSGVEWLGDVPAHWEVKRLSPLSTKITNGYVGPTRDILTSDGVRYLQSLHIKGNQIRFDDPYFVSEEWSKRHSKSILKAGDVLIVQTGDIGQVTVVTEDFVGCNCHALIIVTPEKSVVDGSWISWVLNSDYGVHSLLSVQTGALHPHLNCGDVKDIAIPLPPIAEQRKVVDWFAQHLRAFDALTAEAQRAIDLLQERRTALISAAVTGQIDVRGLGASPGDELHPLAGAPAS